MPKLTPTEATEKHARNLKNSITDIRAGVNRVSVSPTVAAANKIDKMRANLIAAFDDGRVERGLRRVTLEQWKAQMLTKGVNNIAPGIDAATAKMNDFFGKLFPYQASLQATVGAMPDITLADSRNRLTAWFDGMVGFSYK